MKGIYTALYFPSTSDFKHQFWGQDLAEKAMNNVHFALLRPNPYDEQIHTYAGKITT